MLTFLLDAQIARAISTACSVVVPDGAKNVPTLPVPSLQL